MYFFRKPHTKPKNQTFFQSKDRIAAAYLATNNKIPKKPIYRCKLFKLYFNASASTEFYTETIKSLISKESNVFMKFFRNLFTFSKISCDFNINCSKKTHPA